MGVVMKIVLVNEEKYTKLIQAVYYMATCEQLRGCNQAQYKNLLAMPNFVDSEEDVERIYNIFEPITNVGIHRKEILEKAQAAINALKIKGE